MLFSIGSKVKEVKIVNQPVRINLKQDKKALKEVMIVCYVTQKKMDLSASISSMRSLSVRNYQSTGTYNIES
jgi:hypothetical protein